MVTVGGESQQAKVQVMQMTQFILNEAKDKAEEIESKALQDFNIEKLKLESESKEKIRVEYERKIRQMDTQNAIARSTAINKSRIEKIRTRQDVVGMIANDTKAAVLGQLNDDTTAKAFIARLITQGLLILLETEVEVRCRACDNALVQSCLGSATREFTRIVQQETGKTMECKLSLDMKVKLPPPPEMSSTSESCLGGVVLSCQNGTITVDNTIDARLSLVLEQGKPVIRETLFPR